MLDAEFTCIGVIMLSPKIEINYNTCSYRNHYAHILIQCDWLRHTNTAAHVKRGVRRIGSHAEDSQKSNRQIVTDSSFIYSPSFHSIPNISAVFYAVVNCSSYFQCFSIQWWNKLPLSAIAVTLEALIWLRNGMGTAAAWLQKVSLIMQPYLVLYASHGFR